MFDTQYWLRRRFQKKDYVSPLESVKAARMQLEKRDEKDHSFGDQLRQFMSEQDDVEETEEAPSSF